MKRGRKKLTLGAPSWPHTLLLLHYGLLPWLVGAGGDGSSKLFQSPRERAKALREDRFAESHSWEKGAEQQKQTCTFHKGKVSKQRWNGGRGIVLGF